MSLGAALGTPGASAQWAWGVSENQSSTLDREPLGPTRVPLPLDSDGAKVALALQYCILTYQELSCYSSTMVLEVCMVLTHQLISTSFVTAKIFARCTGHVAPFVRGVSIARRRLPCGGW